jgi:hypothetical protein
LITHATDEQYGTFNTLMKAVVKTKKRKEIERLAQQFVDKSPQKPPGVRNRYYCKMKYSETPSVSPSSFEPQKQTNKKEIIKKKKKSASSKSQVSFCSVGVRTCTSS